MNVMTVSPVAPIPGKQNEEQSFGEEGVDTPQQADASAPAEWPGEGSPETPAKPEAEPVGAAAERAEPAGAAEGAETAETAETAEAADDKEIVDEKEAVEEKDEKKTAAKPKRKSAPRKAAGGTKTLVVLKEGRVQYADSETVVVVDLDEASSPDTDVHDVLDRLTELRDAVESPGKADAVKALTDLIQEKALG